MTIIVLVEKVVSGGNHGPFAVAKGGSKLGSITFSLNESVWEEEDWPEAGTYVLVSRLRKKRSGWRAMKARYLRPEDDEKQ